MNGEPIKSPALEAISKIKEAEDRAKAIILEAREKTAVQIIKDAAAEAEKTRNELLARAGREAEAQAKQAVEQAHREAEAIRAETEAETADLRRRAESSFPDAVKRITTRIKDILAGGSV
jgi:vacuolar-type H+-ATPase subunit H